ncbi:MAG: bifunctional ADP-heptose synthase [Crocinitomicaceae bacterium]|jgi:rfaE bifunctional protein kinase chain/domain|nr:bifunctional ADP-heptose synthase [Crocinitomicaceae bacterium]
MDVTSIFNQFAEKRVLVLGDVMIDAYMRGSVTRVSPEAPVPIVNLTKTEERLGGAANVALNLLALGAQPILCSMVGSGANGSLFRSLMDKRGLTLDGIIQSDERKTTVKTRVIGNNQHLLRIDDEEVTSLTEHQENQVIDRVNQFIGSIDAVILEDYNKGVLTDRVIRAVIEMANKNDVLIAVDPKKDNFFSYENVTLFKPNLKELKEGLNVEFDLATDKISFERAIDVLQEKLNNKISFVTLSEHGVFVQSSSNKSYIPAHIRTISDVSGAGDTVISVATLCLAVGLAPQLIAEIANLSGGLVCEVSGVVPINKAQLMEEMVKIIDA